MRGSLAQWCAAVLSAGVGMLLGDSAAFGEDFTVNSTADPGTGACDAAECTLREAIAAANANGGAPTADVISFTVTGAIRLTIELPEITTKTTIDGPGPANLLVYRGENNFRILHLNGSGPGETIRIEGLRIENGDPRNLSGNPLAGGGVFVEPGGVNVLENVVISGNTASDGGGIYMCCTGTTLDVIGSTISGNRAVDANGEGGGIKNSSGQLTVKSSTITGNQVTVAANGNGGGFWTGETSGASALVSNSTIAGNSTPANGGGIYLANGSLFVESSTLARNTSDSDNAGSHSGGGIFVVPSTAGQGASLANTILAENSRRTVGSIASQCELGNMASLLTSDGYNLRSSSGESCDPRFGLTDLVDPAPLLGPLSANGGPTETIPLLPGSPARNAGNPLPPSDLLGSYPACRLTDQRGLPRGGAAGACDIGAFEAQPVPPGQGSTEQPASSLAGPIGSAPRKKCKKKRRHRAAAAKTKRCKKKRRR